MEKIAAIVVTYNKKELLINAVNGILNQELLPDKLIIVDNCSNDGTPECLLKNLWINELPLEILDKNVISSKCLILNNGNKVEIDYIRKFENDGGAGGFYQGMKYAYEQGFDWLWMMDDDGVPAKKCLKQLYAYKSKTTVIGPLVIDIQKKITASFLFDNKGELAKVEELIKKEIIENQLTPFNGTFIPREIISEIGFIKREMFIWGDETEYQQRILKNGFSVKTITQAKHYHPINKKKLKYQSSFLKFRILDISNPKFQFIYFRNYIYLSKEYPLRVKYGVNFVLLRWIYEAIINSFYNFLTGDFYKFKLCLYAVKMGLKKDFSLSSLK